MPISSPPTSDETGDHPLTRTEFQIIRTVTKHPCTLWEVLSAVDGPIGETYRACEVLKQRGWLVFRKGRIHPGKLPRRLVQACQIDFSMVLEKLRVLLEAAPPPTTEYFQEPMLPEDLCRRLEFVWERGDLFDRTFFVIGDDDLFSLAAALTGLPRQIVVGEIDLRLVGYIKEQASRLRLPVEAFQYNVADPLPASFRRGFDVLVMDPVETVPGFTAWLSRGLAALRHPGAIYFGLTELECPPKYWHRFQQLLNEAGLVITDILRGFTRYQNASLAPPDKWNKTKLVQQAPFPALQEEQNFWYRSSFLRAETLKSPKVPVRGRVRFDRSFYQSPFTMTLS